MGMNTEKAVASKSTFERSNNFRYERKFIYTHTSPKDLIATEVLGNGFCFREIFYRRTINNCYLDDEAMTFYHQNVAGDDKRSKYRLRWYGNSFSQIENPVIEIKKKHGAVGDKLSFALKGMQADLTTVSIDTFIQRMKAQVSRLHSIELAENLNALTPSLYNSYERRYFLSFCERFRITIDYNMAFYNPNIIPYQVSKTIFPEVILELKYAVQDDPDARALTQQLTARLSKHSKYVRGVDRINHLQHH